MKIRPTIYVVDGALAVTGGLVAARREATLLRDQVHFILVLPASSKVQAADVSAFERIVRLPMVQLRRSLGSLLLYLPSLLYCGWKLARLLRQDGCTRLQINDFYLMQGAVARLFGYRGMLVTWVRIDPRRFGLAGHLWLGVARRVSDRLVAVSAFIASQLGGQGIKLIYDAYPQKSLSGSAHPATSQKLVFIGNYIEGKGQDKAIAAFSRIAGRFPQAHLLLFGGDMGMAKNRAYRHDLKESVRRSPFWDRIHVQGFARDTGHVLADARAALNFSASESFSLTCQEASAFGVPVIATRCGGPEEIVVDGVTGFLVDVGDVTTMADRMARLLDDPQMAEEMGARGAALVAERFSPGGFRKTVAEIFGL